VPVCAASILHLLDWPAPCGLSENWRGEFFFLGGAPGEILAGITTSGSSHPVLIGADATATKTPLEWCRCRRKAPTSIGRGHRRIRPRGVSLFLLDDLSGTHPPDSQLPPVFAAGMSVCAPVLRALSVIHRRLLPASRAPGPPGHRWVNEKRASLRPFEPETLEPSIGLYLSLGL